MVKDRKLKYGDNSNEVQNGDEAVNSSHLSSWAMKRARSKAFFSAVSATAAVAEESGNTLLLASAAPLLERLAKEMKQPHWIGTEIRKAAELPLLDFRVKMITLVKRVHSELLIPENIVRQERKRNRTV